MHVHAHKPHLPYNNPPPLRADASLPRLVSLFYLPLLFFTTPPYFTFSPRRCTCTYTRIVPSRRIVTLTPTLTTPDCELSHYPAFLCIFLFLLMFIYLFICLSICLPIYIPTYLLLHPLTYLPSYPDAITYTTFAIQHTPLCKLL